MLRGAEGWADKLLKPCQKIEPLLKSTSGGVSRSTEGQPIVTGVGNNVLGFGDDQLRDDLSAFDRRTNHIRSPGLR
jgi:hypothetical protein